MKRRRHTLQERAAAIAAQTKPRRRPTFQEQALVAEIERALEHRQRDVLAALDRLRDAHALPQDPRVERELRVKAVVAAIFSGKREAAA